MNTHDQESREDVAQTKPQLDRGRRRLVQGGIGAAPLLMTLVSRPVLGSVECSTCSGYQSLTRSGTKVSYCTGQTPAWWADSANYPQWPGTILPQDLTGLNLETKPATKFSECFACNGLVTSLAEKTYLEVLQQSGGAPSHFAAALLNVRTGRVPPLNESSLKTMWYEYSTTGQYCPTAGTVWTELDIIKYFESTTV